jgi:hypothetical protein
MQLQSLKKLQLYNEIFLEFTDTFRVMKTKKEYFGVASYVENRIDDAVFLKKDSNECLLIVLQRSIDTSYVFGSARVIWGMKENSNWRFKIGLEFNFEKDYFDSYKENSFENISLLARYQILTMGNGKLKACQIDESYWFDSLKN